MERIKITVMRKERYDDLIEKYENPLEHACDIEEGQVFVLGDNRNSSIDSRRNTLGLIETDKIEGKAFFRIWPFSSFGKVK